MPFTTIRIETELRDQLKTLGRKGETYNEVIKRLVEEATKAETHAKTPHETRSSRSPLLPSDLG